MLTVCRAPVRVFNSNRKEQLHAAARRANRETQRRHSYVINRPNNELQIKKLQDEISKYRVVHMKIATLARWNQRSLESALSDTKQLIELLDARDDN